MKSNVNLASQRLRGRVLPVEFTSGYLARFRVVVGTSNVVSYYRSAALEIEPGNLDERKPWLEPLDKYLIYGSSKPQPLDYYLLSLVQEGLAINSPPREKNVPTVTQMVGRAWWFEAAPISTYRDKWSLQRALSPTIQKRMDQWKLGSPGIDSRSMKSSEQLALLGVEQFTKELKRQSGIACRVQQQERQAQIVFDDCPFCVNQSPLCYVFLGVFEGLLIWLHGWGAESQVLVVDKVLSTGHSIVVRTG